MQSMYGSQNKLHSQRKKDLSIDKYDTDSDEEDHRREEEEIKRIIMKSRIKAASKSKPVGSEALPNDMTNASRVKQESFVNQNPSVTLKGKNMKGFFPTTMNSLRSVDKKDFSQELERTLAYQTKKSKFNHKAKDIRALLEMDINYSLDEKEIQNMLTGTTEPSTTKLPEIRSASKNNDFYKDSFHNLLNLYSRSTSTHPTALFTGKTYLSGKALEAYDIGELSKRTSKSPLQVSFTANDSTEEASNNGGKKLIKDIIPELISAIVANAWEPLDKKDPYDVPRLKMLDWPAIMKKNGAKKLQVVIIDPIEFAIEDCVEINAENSQEIKDKINETIKELNPTTNEAKQILVYYYDEATNEKKLIFTKFFFFLKNHRFYNKNFKNEKDVIMYYVIILALLELRANYETNPFKPEKIEASKKKAMDLVRTAEGFPAFVCEWLVTKIQPVMVVEKVYVNLNVGGKADSNFTFSVHEYLAYTFPSIGRVLHGPKQANGSKSVGGFANKGNRASPVALRQQEDTKDKPKDIGVLAIPKNPPGDTTTRDLKTTQRNTQTHRSTDLPKKKLELSLSVVDLASKDKKDGMISPDAYDKFLPQSMLATLASPTSSNPPDHSYILGKDKESPHKKWPTKLGPIGEENSAPYIKKKILSQPVPAELRMDPKVYLSKQRMNTSYGQLLKHRFAKKNNWSQKL